MSEKTEYIKMLESEFIKQETVKRNIMPKIPNKSKIPEKTKKKPDIKRKIRGIKGILHKKEFPYDIDSVDRIDFEFEDVDLEIKGKNNYLIYALIGLLTIATGATALTDNPVSRTVKRGLRIQNNTDLSNEELLKTTYSKKYYDGPMDDFSEETKKIIEKNKNKISEDNLDEIIKKYGSLDNFIGSLGGVFTKYAGKKAHIITEGDFQEYAEYVWGVWFILGIDYDNTVRYVEWYDKENRFFSDHNHSWSADPFDELLHNNTIAPINCNGGIDQFIKSTDLTNENPIAARCPNGTVVESEEDLQVGDVIHFKGHVAVVGEIHENADGTRKIILYDSGSRFIISGKYKYDLHDPTYDKYGKPKKMIRPPFELIHTLEITDGYSSSTQLLDVELKQTITDGTPISVSSSKVLENIKNTETNNKSGIQGFTFIDDNHFAVAEINGTNGYLSVYDMLGKLLSTTKATTHNNSIQADKDNSLILSIGGTATSGTKHQMYRLNWSNYQLENQKEISHRRDGNAIGMDSYNSKDYIITLGRRTWIYISKR